MGGVDGLLEARRIERAEEAALAGDGLTFAEAMELASTSEQTLPLLFAAALRLRERGKAGVVSYSPKVFIPLTQLCSDFCGYCTFRRDPSDAAPYMSPEDVLRVAKEGERLGCREALFTLGQRPEQKYPEAKEWLSRRGYRSTVDYLAAMCALVLRETELLPHSNPGVMTDKELEQLRPVNASLGMMLESVSGELLEPGGPHALAPSKHPRARLATIARAGQHMVAFTTGILVGLGDSLADQIRGLMAIRDLHRQYGHIQEIIIQNFRAKPHTLMAQAPEPDVLNIMRLAAVARLLFGPEMNIQVPPNLTSQGYARYLDAGINDWGGISPLTPDYVNPEAPWPHIAELRSETAGKGLRLRARYPIYPEFLAERGGFIDEGIAERIRCEADQEGYIPELAEEDAVCSTSTRRLSGR